MKYLLIVIGILLLLLTGSFFYIKHQSNQIEDKESQISYLQSDFKSKSDSIGRSFQDKSDLWHNQVTSLQVTNQSLKQLSKAKDSEIVKIRTLFTKIKPDFRNLNNYTAVKAINKSTATGVSKIDTTSKPIVSDTSKLFYSSNALTEWDAYDLRIYGAGECRIDSFQIDRVGKESFNQAMYWTRKWFLGKKTYHSEIVSLNPNTAIISQNSLVVKKR